MEWGQVGGDVDLAGKMDQDSPGSDRARVNSFFFFFFAVTKAGGIPRPGIKSAPQL